MLLRCVYAQHDVPGFVDRHVTTRIGCSTTFGDMLTWNGSDSTHVSLEARLAIGCLMSAHFDIMLDTGYSTFYPPLSTSKRAWMCV